MSLQDEDRSRGVAVLATANGSLIELDQEQFQLLRDSLLTLYNEMYVESVEADDPVVTKYYRRQMKTIIQLVDSFERIEMDLMK